MDRQDKTPVQINRAESSFGFNSAIDDPSNVRISEFTKLNIETHPEERQEYYMQMDGENDIQSNNESPTIDFNAKS